LNTILISVGVPLLVVIALLGHHLVRTRVDASALDEHQDSSQAVLGLVGTLFSVLIGFMVVASLDNYHDARQHVQLEANALGNIYRLAHGLSDVDRLRIRQLCRDYCNAVIDEEWPLMEQKQTSKKAWHLYQEIWDASVSITPHNERETSILQAILPACYNYGESRRSRIVQSQTGFLPGALWIVIIFGALITVAITYTFSSKWVGYQRVIIVLVSTSLGLNIWLLAVFNSPFAGQLKLQPDMFILDRDFIFQDSDRFSCMKSQANPNLFP